MNSTQDFVGLASSPEQEHSQRDNDYENDTHSHTDADDYGGGVGFLFETKFRVVDHGSVEVIVDHPNSTRTVRVLQINVDTVRRLPIIVGVYGRGLNREVGFVVVDGVRGRGRHNSIVASIRIERENKDQLGVGAGRNPRVSADDDIELEIRLGEGRIRIRNVVSKLQLVHPNLIAVPDVGGRHVPGDSS